MRNAYRAGSRDLTRSGLLTSGCLQVADFARSTVQTHWIEPETLRGRVRALLDAWGLSPESASATAQILVQADLFGIHSHGVAMLKVYESYKEARRFNPKPQIGIERSTPVSALLDADGGLGHLPGLLAVDETISRARGTGISLVGVRNSHHYGAAGLFALRIAEAGLIGMSFTNVGTPSVVPTRGLQPMFGTNPIAFAAPARRNRPFLLDIATSTAAVGKLLVAQRAGRPIPPVWATGADGEPVTDPDAALADRRLLPLGGADEATGGHKGYGLAAMVEILTATLAGASFAPLRDPARLAMDVGHSFIAIDPGLFRDPDDFRADMDALMDSLRACPRRAPDLPVLVHGDKEYALEAERLANGIPFEPDQIAQLEGLFSRAGLRFLSDMETSPG